jgi:membrane protein YqaA with SNARE-associated domain
LFGTTALLAIGESNIWRWLFRLGGIGLIPLGLLDNSPIPVPGAMDVATILLAAQQQSLWLYYALMATIGSLLGGFFTYRIARAGGKEAIEKKFPRRKVQKFYKTFERWGFFAIAIPAMLPPPIPITPFLFVAGALQYPTAKFLAALALGRSARYTILAFLAGRYGTQIIHLLKKFSHPGVAAIALLLASIAALIIYFWKHQQHIAQPAHQK